MTRETKKEFFISFNKADRRWATWLAWHLERVGYSVVFQDWDFRPGVNFVLAMHEAAAKAERTIAVLSPDFLASKFTAPEWAAAFAQDPTGEKGTLVPVRVRECDPEGLLGQIVYIDLLGKNEAEARGALLAGVRRGRAKPDERPDFPAGALRADDDRPHFPGALPPVWNVPVNRNPNFTGREDILADLSEALGSGRPAALTQAIHGLGGVGKTQLAAEYAYRNSHLYEVVWWVRSEEPAALASDYAALAARLGLPEAHEADQPRVARAVRDYLGQNPNWLLVFDNARTQSDLRDYLPQGTTGHVVITSRDRNWRAVASPLQVREMPRAEAVEFLLKRTSQTDADTASQLADALGDLPLALEQAGAYVDQTGQTLAAYLELFRAHHSRLLARGSTSPDYPDTVATTWDISFDEVKKLSPHAEPLINLLAFFAPDDIPLSIIKAGAKRLPEPLAAAVTDPITFDEALAALRRYSLIERDSETVSLHRLLQAVVRDRIGEEEKKIWTVVSLSLVNNAFPHNSDDVRTWSDCARLFPHALSTIEHAQALGIADRVMCRLLNQVGVYLVGRAQFVPAKSIIEQALAIAERVFSANDSAIATYSNNLGFILMNQKDFSGAKTCYERALAIYEFNDDSLNVAKATGNIGNLFRRQNDLAAAQTYLEKALTIFENTHVKDDRDLATSLNNLAIVMVGREDFLGAMKLYERALAIYEANLGKQHPDVAGCVLNMGVVLQRQGDIAGARARFERALQIFQINLGENHPHTQTARQWMTALNESPKHG